MSGVLSQVTARQDVELRRGVTETWAVRWLRDSGSGFVPVDLRTWALTVDLLAPDGSVWLTVPCESDPVARLDGMGVVTVPADALTGPEWASRRLGAWRMNAVNPDDGHVERLGDGYLAITD